MKKYFYGIPIMLTIVASFVIICGAPFSADADEEGASISFLPVRQTGVVGDEENFRAHTWMSDSTATGINAFHMQGELENGASLAFDGRVISKDNDEEVSAEFEKKGFGVLDIHYKMFKKYFNNDGGYYHPHATSLRTNELNQDLDMNIGHLKIGYNPNWEIAGINGIGFFYELHTKKGEKSRTTWSDVKEGSTQRKIGPSWQDVNEKVNIFGITGNTTFAGFKIDGEQQWEFARTESLRHEDDLGDTSGADTLMRFHFQTPSSEMMTTTLKGEKWFNNDKSFLSFAYRFSRIDNEELERIVETDENGVQTNYGSNPEQILPSNAENLANSHTFVGHYMKKLFPHLNISTKFRGEMLASGGTSTYNTDSTGPDGAIDDQNIQDTKSKFYKFGESVSLRYTGLAKTTLFSDWDIGYVHNRLREQEIDDNGSLAWRRDTRTTTQKNQWTIGGRYTPSRVFNMTTQLRYRYEESDFDDKDDTSGVNSAFFDGMKTKTAETSTKVTWKPVKWFHGSARYQFLHKKTYTLTETLLLPTPRAALEQEAVNQSHIFTFDIGLQPIDELYANLSYSRQEAFVVTAAADDDSVERIPRFNANVDTWALSTSYALNEELSFTNTLNYTTADNFDDFTSTGMPFGAAYTRYDVSMSMRWAPKNKDWSIEPKYAYYNLNSPENVTTEFSDYSAHVGWLDFNYDW